MCIHASTRTLQIVYNTAVSTSSASYTHSLGVQEYTIESTWKGQNIITETEHMLTSTLYIIAAKAQLYRVTKHSIKINVEPNKIDVQRDECQSDWRYDYQVHQREDAGQAWQGAHVQWLVAPEGGSTHK